jgi:hypothetical protein
MSLGYQWLFKNGFTVSLGAGLQKTWPIALHKNTNPYGSGSEHFFAGGLYPLLPPLPFEFTYVLRLGYSF